MARPRARKWLGVGAMCQKRVVAVKNGARRSELNDLGSGLTQRIEIRKMMTRSTENEHKNTRASTGSTEVC